jgi:hypothetical protein
MYPHLDVYGVRGQLLRFPFKESPGAEAYAQDVLEQKLIPSGRFIIYGGVGQASFWRRWFSTRGELAEWQHRRVGMFGDVAVVLFQKTGGGS